MIFSSSPSTPKPKTREPLPYPHDDHGRLNGRVIACTTPESKRADAFHAHTSCPGCRAGAMAIVVADPDLRVECSKSGAVQSALDILRAGLDDFDPMRVLFERALANQLPSTPKGQK